jgi:hypothetical protein
VRAEIEGGLRSALEETPPPSIRKLCAEMKLDCKSLSRHFPELYAELTKRALTHYKPKMDTECASNILRLACEEEPPPSIREISQRLGPGGSIGSIKAKFPREYRTIIKRYAARFIKRHDYAAVERALRDSLSQEPPQSVSAICIRFGIQHQSVFHALPELSARVSCRYRIYQKEQSTMRRESAIEEITSNIEAMVREGVRVTQRSLGTKRRVRYGIAEYNRECRRILIERGLY